MPDYDVQFSRVVRYRATVEAASAAAAGVLVGDVIRAHETSERRYTIAGDPEVHVIDEGLGEMTVRQAAPQ